VQLHCSGMKKNFVFSLYQVDISLHNKIWLHLLGSLQTGYYELYATANSFAPEIHIN
jgi:hypothetical protein